MVVPRGTEKELQQEQEQVYRNGPEWTELPEWTTGMDFYM